MANALGPKIDAGYAQAVKGTTPVKIRDIKTILTAPNGIRLVVVKVETTEPGLVGWGCATFTQRALVVQTAVEQYLKPFLMGRGLQAPMLAILVGVVGGALSFGFSGVFLGPIVLTVLWTLFVAWFEDPSPA